MTTAITTLHTIAVILAKFHQRGRLPWRSACALMDGTTHLTTKCAMNAPLTAIAMLETGTCAMLTVGRSIKLVKTNQNIVFVDLVLSKTTHRVVQPVLSTTIVLEITQLQRALSTVHRLHVPMSCLTVCV